MLASRLDYCTAAVSVKSLGIAGYSKPFAC